MYQMQLCGARENEARRVVGSSSSLWSTSREKRDIVDSHVVVLILQPTLPPPVDVVKQVPQAECPRGKLWELIHFEVTQSLLYVNPLQGAQTYPWWDPGITTYDFSSKMKLRKKDSTITYRYYPREEIPVEWFLGWSGSRGHNFPRSSPEKGRDAMSLPPFSN